LAPVLAESPRRRDRLAAIALAALLVWAFALRAWFATPELHAGRFWDERYALENVEALLRDGRWLPVNAFHPTLAHLPQAAVLAVPHGLARATGDPAFAVLGESGFTPLGYLLVRLVQAIFGTLSIYWLARIGRRLFDAPTGLLAAALMAVVPWHLRQSAIFKPDILLLLLGLVAFEWALAAYERPRTGRFARAGLGVGLAAAAKYNGVTAALPLAAGWLFGPGRRRALGWVALAAAAAAATFVVLDPHLLLDPGMLARDFGRTLRDYGRKGQATATGRLDVIAHAFQTLGSETFHGVAVALLAFAGLAWLAVAAVRAAPERRRRLAMLLSFPVGYVLLYAAATNNPSDHNWLPLVPFTSLAAAAPAVAAGRALAARVGFLQARPLLPAAAVLGVLVLATQATAYTYRVAVPSTWDRADLLILGRLGGDSGQRLVWQEGMDRYRVGRRTARQLKPVLVPPVDARAAGIAPETTDARVLVDGESAGDASAPPPGAEVLRLRPRPFRLHGPALTLIFHPWRAAGPPLPLAAADDGAFAVPAPPHAAGERWATVEVVTAPGAPPSPRMAVEWSGRRLPLFWAGTRQGGRRRYVAPRVPAPAGASTLRVTGDPPPPVARLDLHLWLPPATPRGTGP
jgi:4-amino-4-deoxy-L-arabinose transferase-like glycosyltransferase